MAVRLGSGLMLVLVMMLVLVVRVRGQKCPRHIRLCPELFSWEVFLAVDPDIYFRGRDSAAHCPRNLQPSSYPERGDRLFQQPRRYSGIHERAQKHIAAHAGKAL
jgi:hypothetical protein